MGTRAGQRKVRGSLRTAAAALILLLALTQAAAGATCVSGTRLFTVGGSAVGFRQPSDVAVGGDSFFVLDDLNGRIAVFSQDGTFRTTIALPGGSGRSYLGFDIGGDDNFYLASSGEGKIIVLSRAGKVVKQFDAGAGEDGSEPVAVDVSRGLVTVVDNGRHGVRVYNLEGKLQVEWGSLGEGEGGFRYPFRVAQDDDGRIIVSDSLNSRIQVFTPKGEPLLVFGEFGVTEGTLYRPSGISPWGTDQLVVTDNYLGSVQFFDVKGRYRGVLCDESGQPLLLDNPVSVAASGSKLFVLEMGAGRVQAFRVQP